MARQRYEPQGHILVGDEWVMTYSTPYGAVVTEDGAPARSEYQGTAYVRTVIVDGERYDERVDPSTGEQTWIGPDGQPARVDTSAVDALRGPGRIVVVDGETYRGYPNEQGTETWVDESGAVVPGPTPDQEGGLPEVRGYATYDGHRAVVAVDADGQRRLYTVQGEPVDTEVDWAQVVPTPDPGYAGDPIAIGDYTFDGGQVQRVYLFPNGAQAVRDGQGEWSPVIVPTEATYPEGHPVFEGTFTAGVEGDPNGAALQTFAFADGQTAYMMDGELMLVPTGLDVDYPDGPPVNCGEFPGGELYVFPDGRQLLLHDDGTWGIPDFPSIPPYDELQDVYGDPGDDVGVDATVDGTADDPADDALVADAPADGGVDALGLPLTGLGLHELGIGGLADDGIDDPADDLVADPADVDIDIEGDAVPALGLSDLVPVAHDAVAFGADPLDSDPFTRGPLDDLDDTFDDMLDDDGLDDVLDDGPDDSADELFADG